MNNNQEKDQQSRLIVKIKNKNKKETFVNKKNYLNFYVPSINELNQKQLLNTSLNIKKIYLLKDSKKLH